MNFPGPPSEAAVFNVAHVDLCFLYDINVVTARLYIEVRHQIEDMAHYLETDTLRRQANTVVRLTVVTVFGMMGSVVTGIFGMNLFGFAEIALPFQALVLILVVCA